MESLPSDRSHVRSPQHKQRTTLQRRHGTTPQQVSPEIMGHWHDHDEASDLHHVASSKRPNHTSSGPCDHVGNKSDSRRPCTPAPSMTTSDTVSPQSVKTISPTLGRFQVSELSPPSANNPRTDWPAAPDLTRPLLKTNISQPRSHSEYANCEDGRLYQPRRAAPSMPPLDEIKRQTVSQPAPAEISFIDWDDEPSPLVRMKQSLKLAQIKPSKKHIAVRSTKQPKSPERQVNATPRPRQTKSKREVAPVQSENMRQPSNQSESFKTTYVPLNLQSRATKFSMTEDSAYQGLYPTGTCLTIRQNPQHQPVCPNQVSPKECSREHKPGHKETGRQVFVTEQPQRAPGLMTRSANQPIISSVECSVQKQQSLSKNPDRSLSNGSIQQRHTQRPAQPSAQALQAKPLPRLPLRLSTDNHRRREQSPQSRARYRHNFDTQDGPEPQFREYDSGTTSGQAGFLANEAVPLTPLSVTSTTSNTTEGSGPRSHRLKALMKGIVSRASTRNVREEAR